MKFIGTLLLLLSLQRTSAQKIQSIEKELSSAFGKINYWADAATSDNDKISPYDSLQAANDFFETILLRYTASSEKTMSYGFQSLADSGVRIATSDDGRFRIYSWDTKTGGTMHFFRNVFQYKSGTQVFSKILTTKNVDDGDPGCIYWSINDIVSENKKFYTTQSRAVLSSALSYHNIKIFSIEGSKLNDTAKLIKTKSGIRNQLGYEVDLSATVNRERSDVPDFFIEYDKHQKIISIPLILEDGLVTHKKIRNQFKGKYFERL